jgi:carbonic anhydrase/acetyltransferase-like protein (isoleucine patch superfamily)
VSDASLAADMLIARNEASPRIHATAAVAATATIIGDVRIGPRAYVDHGVTIASSGPPIDIGGEAIVFAGTIIRSVGGSSRPEFPVEIGPRTLVSPSCVLTGCRVGANCYVAAAAIVLQGATLGDHVRVGAGALVHASTVLPDRARVGLRHIAVPTTDGFISTADVERAREVVGGSDFFETAFGTGDEDQARLHRQVTAVLLEEVLSWRDRLVG